MSELSELYQQVILDHNKKPRNFRRLADATQTADGYNPLCGDQLTVDLRVADDRIEEAAFEGSGCAISKASASMMTQAVKGKSREEGQRMFRQYVNSGEVNPCIIVDDIIRTGGALTETVKIVEDLGAKVIGCGTIVRFKGAPERLGEDVPIKSLVDFDAKYYDSGDACADCKRDAPVEHVRF